jgi:hypothetical protein
VSVIIRVVQDRNRAVSEAELSVAARGHDHQRVDRVDVEPQRRQGKLGCELAAIGPCGAGQSRAVIGAY